MKAYKGFDKDLKCRGFQYEIGKEYETDEAVLCKKGFHACENPLDTFRYYTPGSSRFCEVELEDVSDQMDSDDSKRVAKKIKIGAELSVLDICKAHFEYVNEHCEKKEGRVAGDKESVSVGDNAAASAGNRGSASAGYEGSASAGDYGSASAGDYGSASAGYGGSASAGYGGSASAGYGGSASAGDYGSASAGYGGSASAGRCGSASAGRCGSASAGDIGIASCRGGKVKGGLNCAICCTEVDNIGRNVGVLAAIVDGVIIKENTWYTVKDGKWVKVE